MDGPIAIAPGSDTPRAQAPTKAGTLTPFLFRLAVLTAFFVLVPHAFAKTIRVMTYNIHVGIGMDKKLDLQRIAGVINKEKPDLVGLQEVDRGVQRTQRIDEIVELSKLTRMEYAFAFNLPYQGGQYGVAILSRFPIRATEHRLYKNLREAERRGFIRAELRIDGRVVHFVTTHLDYQHDDGRLFEAQQMLASLSDVKGPLIVVGDFNDLPSGQTYQLMRNAFDDAWIDGRGTGEGFSYPADKPAKRIDYIFTRRTDGFKTKRAWVVNTLASDHIPVVADLELTKP
ncbi:MAG TPA: endonuclease/exonuclease/phosphatase family protein [Pyrinomonadaceae bacterium]|nr:endonuclease/exonuclease/phosphatase family protein [Pyrinomonadaceae bacterium]